MATLNEAFARSVAVQNIEYLRRLYAKATDLIGIATEASINEGRAIYHRIFSPDVTFSLGPDSSLQGPDAWVDLVVDQLASLGPTQHLIGTQLVEIQSLVRGDDGEIKQGRAHMESYLQAWHEMPGNKVWLFLGTYIDEIEFYPDVGWQICDTRLLRITGETRPMDNSVGAVT
jgi:hypothetical protein